jgi:hypothetical protein
MDWLRLSSISGSHWSGSSSNQNFATLKFDRLLGRARRAMAGVFFRISATIVVTRRLQTLVTGRNGLSAAAFKST